MTWWKRSVGLSVAWVFAAIGPAFGIDPPQPAPSAPMVTKVFDVTELVCVPGDFKLDARGGHSSSAPPEAVCADRLVSNITAMIAPGTWACDGGAGRIEYFERARSLVVCHDKATAERVAAALEKLKKRQETTVAFTSRIVRVPAGTCDATLIGMGIETCGRGLGAMLATLNPAQAGTLLKSVMGDTAAEVLQLPKMAVFHGQTATVAAEEETPAHDRVYTLADGVGYSIPDSTKERRIGVGVTVCPLVAADRQSVRVRLCWEDCSQLPGKVTLGSGSKVTLKSFKDGEPAGPATVELRETAQTFSLKTCQNTVDFRDGGTALFDLGIRKKGEQREQSYLMLSARVLWDETEKRVQVMSVPAPPVAVVAPMPIVVPPPAATASYPYHAVALPPVHPAVGPQVYAQMLLFKTTLDGAKKHGLTDAQALLNETQFESLRAEFTKKTQFEVLTATQMMLLDKQVGYFQDGMTDGSRGEKIRVTPTFSADRKSVRLRVEAECTGPGKSCCDVETTLPDGGTACHPLVSKAEEQSNDERMFLVVTPRFVRTSEDKNCVAVACCTGEAPVMPPPPHAVQPPAAPPTAVFNAPQVHAEMLVVKLTPEVAKAHELNDVVTHCDAMLVEKLRATCALKSRGCAVISSPQMMLLDGQIGYFQCGFPEYRNVMSRISDPQAGELPDPCLQTLRLTPRISEDQRHVQIKLQAECKEPYTVGDSGAKSCDVQSTVPVGRAAIVLLRSKGQTECGTYVIVSPKIVRSIEDRDRAVQAMLNGRPVQSLPVPTVHPQPMLSPVPAQGVAFSALGYQRIDSTPADRKAKAAEWVAAYEKACAGAKGPSPAECALRALAEDPRCFVRPAGK
jgi:hypothetical protein